MAVSGGPTMTSAMLDAAGSGFVAAEAAGPLEQQHLQYANYRAVADSSKVTWTLAHRPGWRFDGMNGVLFELLSSLSSKSLVGGTGDASNTVSRYLDPAQLWDTVDWMFGSGRCRCEAIPASYS